MSLRTKLKVLFWVKEVAGVLAIVLAVLGFIYVLGLEQDPGRQTELMRLEWWQLAIPLVVSAVVAIILQEVGDRLSRRNSRAYAVWVEELGEG